ncbi:PBP1A family penicillin-binding protein [Salibacterium salarium]|uniref:PBP1A family penicillin-binding protein n=1 Tax=Salibacterium salarium TaxID=284579 RepID=A0A428N7M5_9BACI|nr:PBP1A family penicillin-binding protein [Salibacterium salarium]RSL34384.1 PBP1A family penicillin-binding protein [Salibacterium salarium]
MRNKWVIWGLILLGFMLVSAGIYLSSVVIGAAAIDEKQLVMNETTVIYDENGSELAQLHKEDRDMVEIENIPEHVQQAFIAVEDTRFYEHQGIDPRAIARALYRDILAGAKVEGGSTITQQLAKNAFLSNDKTLLRKTKEVLIAMGLERRFSKDQILEFYMNQIYFGHGAYGIKSAAELYYGKQPADLTEDEAAMLAGIPKAPSNYSPVDDAEQAKERRNTVLALMEQQGFINAEETVSFQGKTLPESLHQSEKTPAFYTYIDMVLDEAESKYQLSAEEIYRGGYDIVVPMNKEMQQASFDLFQDSSSFPSEAEGTEAAFFMMNHNSGGVVAVQGGREYVRQGLNRVNVKRQPGSVMKPLAVYAPALETGQYQPYSMLKDEKLDYDGYTPKNYSGEYQGEITMVDAVKESTNTAAVWLYDQLGTDTTSDWMESAGLDIDDNGLAVALGGLSEGLTPLEIASSYTAFSNQGETIEPYFITSITDRNGELVGEADPKTTKVMSEQNAWYMTRLLENVVQEGTGTAGSTNYSLAGKTGTTSFLEVEGATRDAWFTGFTPQWTGSLWMGYDKTTSEQYLDAGSSYPTKLFKEILNQVPADTQAQTAFQKPEDIQDLETPVEMTEVNDLSASLSLKGGGLFNVHLDWTPADDERVIYRVYEVNDDEGDEIAEVEEGGSYTIEGVNIFNMKEYMVVPYNPQTQEEGEPSNVADVSVGSIFGG